MELIERIQARLDYLGWSWADLARAMGMVEQRVNNWRTRGVPARELRNVEAALKVPRYALDVADIHHSVETAVTEIRRVRLKEWFANRTLPEKEKSYLSQLLGGKASFGEKAARRLEKDYGMLDGHLDRPFDQKRVQGEKPLENAKEKRFQNLRWLISTRFGGNAGQCADFLGMKRPQMSRWVTDNEASRQGISEESAREMESKLGLRPRSLDSDSAAEKTALTTDESELLEAWAYLLPTEKEAIMKQIRLMAAHNKAVLEHYSKP